MPELKPRRRRNDPPVRAIDYTVAANGCWVWNWAVHQKGYAYVQWQGRSALAHRASYEMSKGPIPPGMVLRHLCGNPSCVNPAHLKAGTLQENARDMVGAGVQGNQKLTPAEVAEIRRRYAAGGISRPELARQYRVKPATIEEVITHITFYDPNYTPPRPRAKGSAADFDPALARQIRQIYSAAEQSQRELADQFGVSRMMVARIVGNEVCPDPDYTYPDRRAVNQRLTYGQAAEIRGKIRQGAAVAALAREYGVGYGIVARIKAGQSHTGLPRPKPRGRQAQRRPEVKIRPTLLSINGPALTGKEMQAERLREQAAQRAARAAESATAPAAE